jgi:peptidyl-prolyl cis-trans isomerase A (cyclophilin A)
MKFKQILLIPVLATTFAASASAQTSAQPAEEIPDAPQATAAALTRPNGPTVVMDTSMGRITCQFFQRQAPQAVANFIALAEGTKDWTDPVTSKKHHNKPLYNGTIFHRVMPEFMVQGGDPTGTGMGDAGYRFEDEFDPDLNFDVPGRLAMANSGPNTNSSQFFITEVPTEHLNHVHTIFGQCDESSILVVKTIARVQVDRNDKPVTPVVLKKVTIVPEGQPLPVAPNAAPVKRINVSAGVVQAMLLKKTPLTYPQEAKDARVSGTVALRAVISAKGRIESLNIISGPEALKGAALNTVKDWEYKPYLLNGEPVEVETTINVIFALSE